MQNQQWNNIQGNSSQFSAPVPSVYTNQQSAQPVESAPPQAPQYQEENWLEEERPRKGHPVLKSVGLIVGLAGLFCMSTLAGMMADGKRPFVALFKNTAQQAEVKGVSTTVPSPSSGSVGLAVTSASEVGQASGTNDNNATLTPSSPFYQYVDTLGSDHITVARQPLPDDFKGNPGELKGLAARIGASQSFSTNKWGMAYMMTSGDVQVVVVANNQNMVFLRSTQQHSKDDWKQYIETFTLR